MEARILQRQGNAPTDARQLRSRRALTGALLALLARDRRSIRSPFARSPPAPVPATPLSSAIIPTRKRCSAMSLRKKSPPAGHDPADPRHRPAALRAPARCAAMSPITASCGRRCSPAARRASCARNSSARRVIWPSAWPSQTAGCPPILRWSMAPARRSTLLAWWLARVEDYPADEIAAILDRLIIAPLLGGRDDLFIGPLA